MDILAIDGLGSLLRDRERSLLPDEARGATRESTKDSRRKAGPASLCRLTASGLLAEDEGSTRWMMDRIGLFSSRR